LISPDPLAITHPTGLFDGTPRKTSEQSAGRLHRLNRYRRVSAGKSRFLAEAAFEVAELARDVSWIVAVAPSFADAIVVTVDPKLASRLLGKWTGGLDGFGLGTMDRSGTLVPGSDIRPSAVSAMGHVSMFRHGGGCLSTQLGVSPRSGSA
jgi:hypothetical protein